LVCGDGQESFLPMRPVYTHMPPTEWIMERRGGLCKEESANHQRKRPEEACGPRACRVCLRPSDWLSSVSCLLPSPSAFNQWTD
jgi:hypothetical protein